MNASDSERTILIEHNDVEETLDAANAKLKSSYTPLPRPIYVVFLLCTVTPLAFELIFPFVNQMILEIGVVTDPKKVGFYSGVIESIFAAMSFLAIMPCSALSDRYGRKPIIVFGTAGLGVSMSLFGMSTTFGMMVVSRCFAGTLSGSWTAMKVMIGEMTDKTNSGDAFTLLAVFYRIGQIVGQPIGGYLAHPERNFPLFRTQFWYNYPFALPCFVSAIFAVVGVILAVFVLEETLPSKSKGRKTSRRSSRHYGSTSSTGSSTPTSPTETSPTRQISEKKRPSVWEVLTPQVVGLMLNTVGMVFASETLFALYPLFAFTPITSGGLGLTEAQIGTHTAVRAVISILVMTIYARLQRCFGTVRLYQMMMALWPITFMFFPFMNYIARLDEQAGVSGSLRLNATVVLFFVVWSFAALSWTGIGVMSTDASPSAAALATINGISQMAISLPQALSPALATTVFAYSIETGVLGGNLVWVVFISTCTAALLHSFTLKEPSHDWRAESDEEDDG